MQPIFILFAVAGALLATASPALAQRSEVGDRGVRLETNALRTDVRRERLKKPNRVSVVPKAKRRVKVD
ncbi:MAG TPA: hypothetical protein VFR00_04750 [Hyphomicrobiaceae bacterium]|jgi:hypothetical protein|nr:hypothetical protein [Hyphomicrobiaceae bacterium]